MVRFNFRNCDISLTGLFWWDTARWCSHNVLILKQLQQTILQMYHLQQRNPASNLLDHGFSCLWYPHPHTQLFRIVTSLSNDTFHYVLTITYLLKKQLLFIVAYNNTLRVLQWCETVCQEEWLVILQPILPY